MNVTLILSVIAALIGVPALWALVIDIGKWAGWVKDGAAGKISAVCSLITLLVVAGVLQFWPSLNIPNLDGQLLEIVKFLALIFGYVQQFVTTKVVHQFYAKVLKIKAFSFSNA